MAHQQQVDHEVQELKKYIRRLGAKNDKGQYVVKFGVLFDDDEGIFRFHFHQIHEHSIFPQFESGLICGLHVDCN